MTMVLAIHFHVLQRPDVAAHRGYLPGFPSLPNWLSPFIIGIALAALVFGCTLIYVMGKFKGLGIFWLGYDYKDARRHVLT